MLKACGAGTVIGIDISPARLKLALELGADIVINGQEVDSPAYRKKLEFLEHLTSHLTTLLSYEEKVIIGGDYNIAPDHKDVWDPKAWEGFCTQYQI
jgi:exodeoxyribonuclease-3